MWCVNVFEVVLLVWKRRRNIKLTHDYTYQLGQLQASTTSLLLLSSTSSSTTS